MVRKKKEKVEDDQLVLDDIMKATGGQSLAEAGRIPYYIDTGNLSINYKCSGKFIPGGWPGGRIIESFGPEASGKSLLGYCFLGNVQRMGGIAIHLDCERSGNPEFAERCGHVDVNRLITYYPITLEQVEKSVTTVVNAIRKKYKDVPIGIMWDSIGVCPTERSWNQIDLPENPTKQQIKEAGGQERPGERAKAASDMLRRLNPFLNENNATIYVVNQLRKKIGVLFGSDETTEGGGESLKYYASLRIRTSVPKAFQDSKRKIPIGVNLKVKNKKNRFTTPGLEVENVPLFFNCGIHPTGGLVESLIKAGRIEGSGTYTVQEPWAGGEEIKFRAKKTDPLDPEILFKCPALVDADSAEDVKEYLAEWQTVMDYLNSGEVEEVGGTDDSDVEHLMGSNPIED